MLFCGEHIKWKAVLCLLCRIRLHSCPGLHLSWAASPRTLNWISKELITVFWKSFMVFYRIQYIVLEWCTSAISCFLPLWRLRTEPRELLWTVFLVCLCISCSLKTLLGWIFLRFDVLNISHMHLNSCIFNMCKRDEGTENSSVTVSWFRYAAVALLLFILFCLS